MCWNERKKKERTQRQDFERENARENRKSRVGKLGGNSKWTLRLLCKRGHFERRSAGQLMRRSGRVNQLTAGEVPIRPLLSVFPSATRFCPARHTTGTHQLASGRSCTRSAPDQSSPFLFYSSSLLASSSSSSHPFRPRWARADREQSTFLSSGFLE